MITNVEKSNSVCSIISAAKPKKKFRTDATRAKWLAEGERVLGVYGSKNLVIHSPAGARQNSAPEMLLVYGAEGVLVHEELAGGQLHQWFEAEYCK